MEIKEHKKVEKIITVDVLHGWQKPKRTHIHSAILLKNSSRLNLQRSKEVGILYFLVKLLCISRFHFNEVCMKIASFASGITAEKWKIFTRCEWSNALEAVGFQFLLHVLPVYTSTTPIPMYCFVCVELCKQTCNFQFGGPFKSMFVTFDMAKFLCLPTGKVKSISINHYRHNLYRTFAASSTMPLPPVCTMYMDAHFTKICYLSYFFFL